MESMNTFRGRLTDIRTPVSLSFFAVFAMVPLSMLTSLDPVSILVNTVLVGLFVAMIPVVLAGVFFVWIGLEYAPGR